MNAKQLIFNNANGEFDTLIANGYYFARSEGGATDDATLKFEAEQAANANLIVIGRGEPVTKYYFDLRDCYNAVVRREGFDIDARLEWLSRTVDEVRSRCENIAEHYIPEEDTAEYDELGRISVHLGRLAKRLHDLAGIYTPVQHFDND